MASRKVRCYVRRGFEAVETRVDNGAFVSIAYAVVNQEWDELITVVSQNSKQESE